MEPHSYECGNEGHTFPTNKDYLLQWSRTLTSAEMGGQHLVGVRLAVASMEPHSYECGNMGHLHWGSHLKQCFNGAALLRVRKFAKKYIVSALSSRLQWSRTLTSAEIRPLHHHRPVRHQLQWSRTLTSAKISMGKDVIPGRFKLQWSRTLTSAEMTQSSLKAAFIRRLQWSRTLTSAEISDASYSNGTITRLQWSRTLTSAEIKDLSGMLDPELSASMEPHSYECGNGQKRWLSHG